MATRALFDSQNEAGRVGVCWLGGQAGEGRGGRMPNSIVDVRSDPGTSPPLVVSLLHLVIGEDAGLPVATLVKPHELSSSAHADVLVGKLFWLAVQHVQADNRC